MTQVQLKQIIGYNDIMELSERIMNILFGDIEARDAIFRELLSAYSHDLSYDWFQPLYEEELAQRKQNKQDFTPSTVGLICSMLVGEHATVHEPTAGNGSMIIQDWYNAGKKALPWNYRVDCWELSDRSIPLLLLNLSIRGINGTVHHGDVLEQNEKARYLLTAKDPLSFSRIIKVL